MYQTEKVGPELSDRVGRFLRECDERKFALSPPRPPLGAVSRAAEFIQEAERRRAAGAAAEGAKQSHAGAPQADGQPRDASPAQESGAAAPHSKTQA